MKEGRTSSAPMSIPNVTLAVHNVKYSSTPKGSYRVWKASYR